MKQLFLDADLTSAGVAVDAATTHRLRRVLRLKGGDRVTLADGRGGRRDYTWTGRSFDSPSALQRHGAPARRIELGVGLLKGPRWPWLLEKATELGVDDIAPLQLEHCVAVQRRERGEKQTRRWQTTLIEAFEQCGRATLPRISAATTLDAWLAQTSRPCLYADERGGAALDSLLRARGSAFDRVCILVGPEGGFSTSERSQLDNAGAVAVSLGETVLRSETAAIVAIATAAAWRRTQGS